MLILLELGLALLGLGLVALGLVGLPGTWLWLAVCALAEWGTDTLLFHPVTLTVAVSLAVLGEVAEFLAGSQGAKRAGAGRAGSLGALAGGFVGAVAGTLLIPVPVVGTLMGGALGAFSLATLAERRDGQELRGALRAGSGAALGQFLGLVLKLCAGVACWVVLAVALLWP